MIESQKVAGKGSYTRRVDLLSVVSNKFLVRYCGLVEDVANVIGSTTNQEFMDEPPAKRTKLSGSPLSNDNSGKTGKRGGTSRSICKHALFLYLESP